jgi:NAD-dependent dihydropyrimidine dehydrogenase PreA subunit
MNLIEIDLDACTACQTCYDACFVDVYRWDAENDEPIVAYPEDCVQCNKCELECPAECIKVVPDFAGYYWPEVV